MTPTETQSTALSQDNVQDVIIKCAKLNKTFRDFWYRNRVCAVDDVNLDIHRGEVFGLLGPNGSGKSTTIKMILGLLHPTSGRIAVFGKRPDDVGTKKQIGYLPEESYMYRFLNARETLDYYGKLFYQNRPERQRRIDMLLEMVGLAAVQRRPVGEYSKGMQRRIGLAQALINDPKLLILDEPTTGLDPIGTRQIKDLILTLKERGKTILLCSHLLTDVEDVCDRIAVMYGGKIQRLGPVDQLLQEEDATTLRTQKLDADTISAIDALLASRGKHLDQVQQPRKKLESLFLEIVDQAKQAGVATSGAQAGGAIPDFLSADQTEAHSGAHSGAHLPESVQTQVVIDQLMEHPPSSGTPGSTNDSDGNHQVDETQTASPKEPQANTQILEGLEQASGPVPTGNASADEPLAQPDLSVVDALVKKSNNKTDQ